jgi:hypothetical protein
VPHATAQRLLDIWRDLERLIEELPQEDSLVGELRAQADEVRARLGALTRSKERTTAMIEASHQTIERATQAAARARLRIERAS